MTMTIKLLAPASQASLPSGRGIPTTPSTVGRPAGLPALNGFGASREGRAVTRTAARLAGDCHPWLENTTADGLAVANRIATMTTGPVVAGIGGFSEEEDSVPDATQRDRIRYLNFPIRIISRGLASLLKQIDIRYVAELCQKTEADLLAAGVSQTLLTNTRTKLADLHLTLSMNIPAWQRPSPITPSHLTIAGDDQRLARKLDDLSPSPRVANVFHKMHWIYVGDLCTKTEADLRTIARCGRRTIKEIKELLAEKGLSLGMTIRGDFRRPA